MPYWNSNPLFSGGITSCVNGLIQGIYKVAFRLTGEIYRVNAEMSV